MSARRANSSPIRRGVSVSWAPAEAFRRFTADFAAWWPRATHSIGGRRVQRVVMECRVGGAIYEEHHDGTRYLWGRVTTFDPPRRLGFAFHAAYAPEDAQQVEITFAAEGSGTRVDLVSSGWERMREHARRSRGGYAIGWPAVLDRYAGRFSVGEILFILTSWAIDLTGQRSTFMRNSLGRVSPSAPEGR